MRPEKIDLSERAQQEHAAALVEFLTALTAMAEDLGEDSEPENRARAQVAKLRLENAYALLQFIQGKRQLAH